MTGEAAACFKQVFSVRNVAALLRRKFAIKTVLPKVSSYRVYLILTVLVAQWRHAGVHRLGETPEGWHLGARTETLRVCQPLRHPFLAQLQTNVLKIWSDLLLILHQILRLQIQLIDPRRQDTVRHL